MSRHSAVYEGWVRHRRFWPVRNEFRYKIFFLYLDLAELPTVFQGCRFWSTDRVNLAYLRRRDHLGDPAIPLAEAVRKRIQTETGQRPTGPIRLLTHLRYFGHCFNPVSFYYCFGGQEERLDTVMLEVHNTPWLEEHCYVLPAAANVHPHPEWRQYRLNKTFHVSPFMPMAITYDLRIRQPGASLAVHFRSFYQDRQIFDATLALQRREFTPPALDRLLWRYPPMTLKVVAMIYWQAWRLWRRGAPYFPHPRRLRPPEQYVDLC